MTKAEAKDAFICALEAELEVAKKDDVAVEYLPTSKLADEPSRVYIGALDDEVAILEGSPVRVEDRSGRWAYAEVVTVEDFELVIATEMELKLNEKYTIKYNLAWLLEALLKWIKEMDESDPSPIATALVKPTERIEPIVLARRPQGAVGLNEYQLCAVLQALNSSLAFVWGPPGTGKSRTMAQLAVEYLLAGKSVLFVSLSNIAVDIVAKQVFESDSAQIQRMKSMRLLLRSGYPAMQPLEQWRKVMPYELALLERPFLKRKLDELYEERKKLLSEAKANNKRAVRKLQENTHQLVQVKNQVRQEVAVLESRARFIATTLAKISVTPSIKGRTFDAVVIDEASMMSVPASFTALTLAAKHGVVAGDFFQLPPIQTSSSAKARRWLARNAFMSSGIMSQVMSGSRNDPRLAILKRQYRMAEEISGLANAMFYGGILEDAEPHYRRLIPEQQLYGKHRLVLIDVSRAGTECLRDPYSQSRLNPRLAAISSNIARSYMEKGIKVGIITPYRAQAREIRKHFTREELRSQVQVATVHKFQGSERDIIIFEIADSYPMSRPSRLISGSKEAFLNEGHVSPTLPLVNVALTRAKSQIILVANIDYVLNLARSNILRQTVLYFCEKGVVIDQVTGKIIVQAKPTPVRTDDVAAASETPTAKAERVDVKARVREYFACACGGKFVPRQSRSGRYFLGCSNYPQCTNTRRMDDESIVFIMAALQPKCPDCGGPLFGEAKKGWPFLHCSVCGRQLSKEQVRATILQFR